MAKKYRNRLISQDENGDTTYVREEIKDEPATLEKSVLGEPSMDFESWFVLRREDIPTHHHEEIIRADFNARKVPGMATVAEFDAALKKYGIELD
jgi:hypothetical protein